LRFLCDRLVDDQSVRPSLGVTMEYLIAGAVALALGAYLLYALLRPERF
jgi:K+-transporting ATPase KdpF subunit